MRRVFKALMHFDKTYFVARVGRLSTNPMSGPRASSNAGKSWRKTQLARAKPPVLITHVAFSDELFLFCLHMDASCASAGPGLSQSKVFSFVEVLHGAVGEAQARSTAESFCRLCTRRIMNHHEFYNARTCNTLG